MGPEAAKSFPGQHVVLTAKSEAPQFSAGRAKQEIDYVRREQGYIFGAFQPATGEVLTAPYLQRTAANGVDVLERSVARIACS